MNIFTYFTIFMVKNNKSVSKKRNLRRENP